MRHLTILLDLDDILNNQTELWVDDLNRRYSWDVEYEELTDWDMRLFYPNLTDQEIYEPVHSGILVPYMNASKQAIQTTTKWSDAGHDLFVVSATNAENVYKKIIWLKAHYSWFDESRLILCQYKELIFGDVLIDDGPHNLQAMQQYGANPDCVCVCLDKPWNRNTNVLRAKSWQDINAVIQELERE